MTSIAHTAEITTNFGLQEGLQSDNADIKAALVAEVFDIPARMGNPLRINATLTENEDGIVLMPSCLTEIAKNQFARRFNKKENDIVKILGCDNETDYWKHINTFVDTHESELMPFILQLIAQRQALVDQGIAGNSDAAFLVHVGLSTQAIDYGESAKSGFNDYFDPKNISDSDYLFKILGRTPSFLMKREQYQISPTKSITCETINAPFIPSTMIGSKGEYFKEGKHLGKQAALEGVIYSTYLRGSKVVGLGGLLGMMTDVGIEAQLALDVLKVATHRQLAATNFSTEYINKYLSHLDDMTVTTGHSGTIFNMVKTYMHYYQNFRNQATKEKLVVAVFGAGNIGSSFLDQLVSNGAHDTLREVRVFDIRSDVVARVVEAVMQSISLKEKELEKKINITVKGFSPHKKDTKKSWFQNNVVMGAQNAVNFLNFALGADVLAVAIASDGTFLDEKNVGFTTLVLDRVKKGGLFLDDNHPGIISKKAIARLFSRGIIYTGVGSIAEVEPLLLEGNTYNLDKPDNVGYGCKAEALVVAATMLISGESVSGIVGQARPNSVRRLEILAAYSGLGLTPVLHTTTKILKQSPEK